MNRPLRNDDTENKHPDWNQSPNYLSGDGVTRQDLNGIANLRLSRDHLPREHQDPDSKTEININESRLEPRASKFSPNDGGSDRDIPTNADGLSVVHQAFHPASTRWNPKQWQSAGFPSWRRGGERGVKGLRGLGMQCKEFASFLGPGFLIAVAYIDPGNYATDVAAGAATKFQLLFIVLMSNIFAVVLQTLSIRLGTVTGRNLAEHCRAHLPRWLNIIIYLLAEAAIIATDLAEVIGSAIALNLLFGLNLVAGCAITLIDVLLILLFYNPNGSMKRLRIFELFVGSLVLAVVICFCIQLSLITGSTAGEVMKGYIPSSAVVTGQGIYLSCGILGATVMPHSIYLGSGLCQPRLKDYDQTHGTAEASSPNTDSDEKTLYIPSLSAIKHCLRYSTAELVLTLTGFALFVNSAILITAGDSLSSVEGAQDADLFGIFDLLRVNISRAAAIIFAVALFFSGTAAGIVCTIAGQMVSEGHLNWTIAPWLRRLLTRSISITPAIIIAASIGREGLSTALTASQVALSVILPFVTAPLVYFTARSKFMTVGSGSDGAARNASHLELTSLDSNTGDGTTAINEVPVSQAISMRNHVFVTVLAFAIWLVITVMNVALLVLLGLGQS